MLLTLVVLFISIDKIAAVTIDSSSGFNASYPAANTIDGIYGNSNMGWAAYTPAWAIYDFGANPQTIRKFRITPPLYGGVPPQTYNPMGGTIEFSNDKVNWTAAINWIMPALESIGRTDYSEVALPSPMTYRYVRINFNLGRVSEIFFPGTTQLAVWEMAQDTYNSNNYPAINTCDGDSSSFGASINSEGAIIYDQGISKYFCGFVMTSRNYSQPLNPTGGSVYASDDPTANWTLVGNWTLAGLTNGNKGIVTFNASQAKKGRYIKLSNISGGDQWAEFECLLPIVNTNIAKTAIIIPDGITIGNQDTFVYSDRPVLFAAKELRYHVKKATQNNAILGIYNESQKPSTFTNFIYLGNCIATQNEGLSAASLTNSQAIIRCKDGNLFIIGNDTDGNTLGSSDSIHYMCANDTHAGTLFGVYDFLDNQLGIHWLWPGTTGEYIPVKTDIIISPYEKTVTPKFIHSRFRDNPSTLGWSSQNNCYAFLDAQQQWLRRHGFVRNITFDYDHSFSDWWTKYGTAHPEYFNRLPDGTRRADPYYCTGATSVISMCLSNADMHAQKITEWLAERSPAKPWIEAAEDDTNTKCTCSNCLAWDVYNSTDMTLAEWNNRVTNATTDFNNASGTWSNRLGSMSDRFARYLLAVQTEAESRDNNNPATLVAYAYANYRKPPVSTTLNNRIIMAYVPEFSFPWSQAARNQTISEITGWQGKGVKTYLRPNYMLLGHNYPIFFADKFGDDLTSICQNNQNIATDYDSLAGQYGAQALNLYMVARMNNKVGQLSTTAITSEFYSAFGPAANAVSDYFNYLQSVSNSQPDTPIYNFWDFFITGDVIFTSTVRAQMRSRMNSAISAAAGNADATAKVDFLNKGLIHAEKTLAAADAWRAWVNNGANPGDFNSAVYDLDVFRAANETTGFSNLYFTRLLEDYTWYPANRNSSGGYAILPYSFNVACGNMFILHGDLLCTTQPNFPGFYCRNYYGNDICLVLDLGIAKRVDKIININRTDVATNYGINNIEVYVAADENSTSFNKYNQACYTQQVFSGIPTPVSNQAGTVRYADIANADKRYFLIKVISTFWGNVATDGQTQHLYSSDFDIVEY